MSQVSNSSLAQPIPPDDHQPPARSPTLDGLSSKLLGMYIIPSLSPAAGTSENAHSASTTSIPATSEETQNKRAHESTHRYLILTQFIPTFLRLCGARLEDRNDMSNVMLVWGVCDRIVMYGGELWELGAMDDPELKSAGIPDDWREGLRHCVREYVFGGGGE